MYESRPRRYGLCRCHGTDQSVLLTYYVSPNFVWFTVFIGLNLFQASLTGFCPAAWVFKLFGVPAGNHFK